MEWQQYEVSMVINLWSLNQNEPFLPLCSRSSSRCTQGWWPQQAWYTMCSICCTSLCTSGMCVCSWLQCSVAWPPSPPSYWRGSCGTKAPACLQPASSPLFLATSHARLQVPSTMKASPSLPCSSPTTSGYVCTFCITYHYDVKTLVCAAWVEETVRLQYL